MKLLQKTVPFVFRLNQCVIMGAEKKSITSIRFPIELSYYFFLSFLCSILYYKWYFIPFIMYVQFELINRIFNQNFAYLKRAIHGLIS